MTCVIYGIPALILGALAYKGSDSYSGQWLQVASGEERLLRSL
jgi:hypothetical protein